MNCPFCNYAETRVVDSRDTNEGRITRRRRECTKCEGRFSTYEEIELLRLVVIKRNGEKTDYDKSKIASGIRRALVKRPINEDRIMKLLSDIEYAIKSLEKTEVTTKEIGKIILNKLRDLDEVAYVRFASVYKSFGSVESFKKELDMLDK
jgi:transcriptional repressor NrdR